MNESRNRFFFPAVLIVAAIAILRAMSKGRLSDFLLEQGLMLLAVGAVVGTLVWTDRRLRKGHSSEWMRRYYRWVRLVFIAVVVTGVATAFILLGLKADSEGAFGQLALPLLSCGLLVGTIVGMDMFFRKRRSDQWMNGFRICMALVVVALLTGLVAYLLSRTP